jgi:hypothetical protein
MQIIADRLLQQLGGLVASSVTVICSAVDAWCAIHLRTRSGVSGAKSSATAALPSAVSAFVPAGDVISSSVSLAGRCR